MCKSFLVQSNLWGELTPFMPFRRFLQGSKPGQTPSSPHQDATGISHERKAKQLLGPPQQSQGNLGYKDRQILTFKRLLVCQGPLPSLDPNTKLSETVFQSGAGRFLNSHLSSSNIACILRDSGNISFLGQARAGGASFWLLGLPARSSTLGWHLAPTCGLLYPSEPPAPVEQHPSSGVCLALWLLLEVCKF